jgi:hypothetical protein
MFSSPFPITADEPVANRLAGQAFSPFENAGFLALP